MNIAIIGGRDFDDYDLLAKSVIKHYGFTDIDAIISGGAKGADSLAERFAKDIHVPMKVFPAEWDIYGKSAGYKRNVKIITSADVVFAFWDGHSKGTKHSIDIARAQGKVLNIINY
jgi:hypothetical protein